MKTKIIVINKNGKKLHTGYFENIPSRGDIIILGESEYKVINIKWNYDKNDNHVQLIVEDITP